jgi:hypothetical protein|tara:strand:- start:1274 stop:1492 length:219 start_codon:yes stop_codon:yes gene_type:complete
MGGGGRRAASPAPAPAPAPPIPPLIPRKPAKKKGKDDELTTKKAKRAGTGALQTMFGALNIPNTNQSGVNVA